MHGKKYLIKKYGSSKINKLLKYSVVINLFQFVKKINIPIYQV